MFSTIHQKRGISTESISKTSKALPIWSTNRKLKAWYSNTIAMPRLIVK